MVGLFRAFGRTISHRRLFSLITLVSVLAFAALTVTAESLNAPMSAPIYYYVAPDGDDSNPGTESQPWRTIQHAADTMVAGDTVYVRGGIYHEQVAPQDSGTPGDYITYQAYPGETVVMDGQNTQSNGFAIGGRSYLVIDGFEIRNQVYRSVYINSSDHLIVRNNVMADWGLFGIEAENGSSYIEIANNEITNDRHGNAGNGTWFTDSQHFDIHHNRVHDCPTSGIALGPGAHYNKIHHNLVYGNGERDPEWWEGIGMEVNSSHNQVYNNIVYNNKHAGILTNSEYNTIYHNIVYSNPDSNGWGGGIYFCNWDGSLGRNNIVRDNIIIATGLDERTVISQDAEGRDNLFDNNIHWHVSQQALIDWGPGVYITYSQWQSDYGQEPNGSNIDPLIVGGDPLDPSFYKLQPDSPAIDAGADVGVVEDFDGNPRPQGAGYDIGAYEYTYQPYLYSNPKSQ